MNGEVGRGVWRVGRTKELGRRRIGPHDWGAIFSTCDFRCYIRLMEIYKLETLLEAILRS
jgi:hypothetical protein